MKRNYIANLIVLTASLLILPVRSEEKPTPETTPQEEVKVEKEGHSIGHKLLFYIPNRLFDVIDIVRLKLQVGPGLTAAARVTELGDVWLGGHTTVWVGLPGSRGKPKIPLPIGIDSKVGAKVSLVDLTAQAGDRYYPPDEVGLDLHLLFIGAGAGVSVVQAVDAALGFLFIDISGDDL